MSLSALPPKLGKREAHVVLTLAPAARVQGELDDWLAAHFRHALRLKRFAKPREGCTAPTCIEELAACTSWDAEVSSKVGFTRRDREGILIFKAMLLGL